MPLDEKSPGLRLCDAAMKAPPSSSSSHHAVLQWIYQAALISVEDFDRIITSDTVDGFSKDILVRVDDPVIEKFPEDLENLEPGTIIGFFGCSKGIFKKMFKFKETPTLQHSMVVLPNKLVVGVRNEECITDQTAMKVGDLHAVLQWSQLFKPPTQTVRYQSLETVCRRVRSFS